MASSKFTKIWEFKHKIDYNYIDIRYIAKHFARAGPNVLLYILYQRSYSQFCVKIPKFQGRAI